MFSCEFQRSGYTPVLNVISSPLAVAVTGLLIVTFVFESITVTTDPACIPDPVTDCQTFTPTVV